MKRYIVFLIILFLPLYVFSASFGFGILWELTNSEVTSLSILNYEGTSSLSEYSLEESNEEQQIFMMRYTTNKGGIHTISYKATPFTDGVISVGYKLKFLYNGDVSELEVGSDKDMYPVDSIVATTISVPFGKGSQTFEILGSAILTDIASFGNGNYSSTIYIERVTT